MSSTYGEKIKISVFGESHGNGIGVVIDGLPAGVKIDMDKVLVQMSRRAPGKDKTATPRKESDLPKVLSGMLGDTLTGAPLCAVIENTNTKSGDYGNLLNCPRPGHSDYTAYVKYNASNDIRGGGHFSGRLTAPIVFAGAICRQILEEKGIKVYKALVGPFACSMDMAGMSVTLMKLDDELKELMDAPCDTPYFTPVSYTHLTLPTIA